MAKLAAKLPVVVEEEDRAQTHAGPTPQKSGRVERGVRGIVHGAKAGRPFAHGGRQLRRP